MAEEPFYKIVAIGTWLYDGRVSRKVELLARPAKWAGGRWIEDDLGEFVLNDAAPMPQTPDGFVYYLGTTEGGEFATEKEARAWANTQPWGPIRWRKLIMPRKVSL